MAEGSRAEEAEETRVGGTAVGSELCREDRAVEMEEARAVGARARVEAERARGEAVRVLETEAGAGRTAEEWEEEVGPVG